MSANTTDEPEVNASPQAHVGGGLFVKATDANNNNGTPDMSSHLIDILQAASDRPLTSMDSVMQKYALELRGHLDTVQRLMARQKSTNEGQANPSFIAGEEALLSIIAALQAVNAPNLKITPAQAAEAQESTMKTVRSTVEAYRDRFNIKPEAASDSTPERSAENNTIARLT